jgi:ferredoxin
MKFKLIYEQEVEIEAKNKEVALSVMRNDIPFVSICGGSCKNGHYTLNSGKFRIVSCERIKKTLTA